MTSDPDPIVTVALTVTNQMDQGGDALRDVLDVVPTRSFNVGETRTRPTGRVLPSAWSASGWRVEVGPRRTLEMPAMFDELVRRIEPSATQLAEMVVAGDVEVEISAHIKMVEQAPIGTIPRALVALAARLEAELDVDLYVVEPGYTEAGLES